MLLKQFSLFSLLSKPIICGLKLCRNETVRQKMCLEIDLPRQRFRACLRFIDFLPVLRYLVQSYYIPCETPSKRNSQLKHVLDDSNPHLPPLGFRARLSLMTPLPGSPSIRIRTAIRPRFLHFS